MLLALLLVAVAAEERPAPNHGPAVASAPAFATILKPAIASKANWDRAPRSRQKQIFVTDEEGRKIQIRLIEYE
jgi:hypothetical protein